MGESDTFDGRTCHQDGVGSSLTQLARLCGVMEHLILILSHIGLFLWRVCRGKRLNFPDEIPSEPSEDLIKRIETTGGLFHYSECMPHPLH